MGEYVRVEHRADREGSEEACDLPGPRRHSGSGRTGECDWYHDDARFVLSTASPDQILRGLAPFRQWKRTENYDPRGTPSFAYEVAYVCDQCGRRIRLEIQCRYFDGRWDCHVVRRLEEVRQEDRSA